MRGDDQLAFLIDGVDDAGREVGEGFADAGAGFKEERGVGLEDGGDGARHRLLLRAVFEESPACSQPPSAKIFAANSGARLGGGGGAEAWSSRSPIMSRKNVGDGEGRGKVGRNEFAGAARRRKLAVMNRPIEAEGSWVAELVQFLRTEPGVCAVRIDPGSHTLAVATFGEVDLALLSEKLAATIAAVDARLEREARAVAPAGFSLRQEGGAMVLARDSCVTAEKIRPWRELEWPGLDAVGADEEPEWKFLATLAAVCGGAGVAGALLQAFAPGSPWAAWFSSRPRW